MNLDVLNHIVTNDPSLIEDLAVENKLDGQTSIGIAKILLGNDGDISTLSEKQSFHYEKFIKPLIENVQCEGIYGQGTCTGSGYVDDELLLECYISNKFLCQHCQYDAKKHDAE